MLGFGFILCLILAIVFRAQVTRAQDEREAVEDDAAEYVSVRNRSSADFTKLRDAARNQKSPQTLVEYLRDQNRRLKTHISSHDATMSGIATELKNLNLAEGVSLTAKVKQLTAELDRATENARKAKEDLEDANARAGAAVSEKQALASKFDDELAEIRSRYEELHDGFDSFKQAREDELTALDDQLRQSRTDMGSELKDLRSKISELERELTDIGDQTKGRDGPEGPKLTHVVDADGYIVSFARDSDLVYINLSREDRVQPGMTFEVFEADRLIKFDDLEKSRGIATIEVVKPLANASVARIVRRSPRKVVAAENQIANIVYDPNARFRFHVHGKFDIDGVGVPSTRDTVRIAGMIRRWGGDVTETAAVESDDSGLDYNTDYLVVGVEPDLPTDPGEDAPPTERVIYEKKKNSYLEHQQMLAEAQKLHIPILNQNRFLRLVGYYQR
ncbi:MAG: hypothetical protein CMJ18_23260 [Phycisphaeraceae bacterium]|nr:hypothetical protein [Phycisphaeraceae bacterium]